MYTVWMGTRNVPLPAGPRRHGFSKRRSFRILIAAATGLLGFALYLGLAATVADWLEGQHWAARALYYAIAGVLWVLPARWLMIWASRADARQGQ